MQNHMLFMTNYTEIGGIQLLSIRNIQSRDILFLADLFDEQDENYFNTLYIDHLQATRHSVIAMTKTDAGDRDYLGYISIVWESGYTQFWRRNIPEITDLFVHENYRRQGIATQLIKQCEQAVKARGLKIIGISVEQTKAFKPAQALYEKLGYKADDFGVTSQDNQYHLIKTISYEHE